MKTGFIPIAHTDYTGCLVNGAAAVSDIESTGAEIISPESLVCDSWQAVEAGRLCVSAGAECVILFFCSWVECPVIMSVLREVEHLPLLVWGVPMIETDDGLKSTGSYVAYAMFKGVLERAGYAYKGVLGPVGDPACRESIRSFLTAAHTHYRLKHSRVGLMGYSSMGIYPGTFDHLLMRVRIGPEIEHMDLYTYINRINNLRAVNARETRELLNGTRLCISPDVADKDLDTAGRMFRGLIDIKNERRWDAVNIKCQYELSKEFGMIACVPLSWAASKDFVTSCEGDILNTVSMLILNYLTGEVVSYGDAIHHEGNDLLISSCGFSPFCFAAGESVIKPFASGLGFSGLVCSHRVKPGLITAMRLIEDIGDYHILFFTGEGMECPLRDGFLPALNIRLHGDMDKLVNNYAGQHFAFCYGDQSGVLMDLARILKINAVRV